MSPSVEEGKNLLLKLHAEQIRRQHPKWSRATCFAAAQREHPELTEQFAEPPPEGEKAHQESTLAAIIEKYTSRRVAADRPRKSLDEILAERLRDSQEDEGDGELVRIEA